MCSVFLPQREFSLLRLLSVRLLVLSCVRQWEPPRLLAHAKGKEIPFERRPSRSEPSPRSAQQCATSRCISPEAQPSGPTKRSALAGGRVRCVRSGIGSKDQGWDLVLIPTDQWMPLIGTH